jgi:hypothetical protein
MNVCGCKRNLRPSNVIYSRVSEYILYTVPERTVTYRFPLEHFSRSRRSLSARRNRTFLPKILRFSAKKVKSANRTVFKIKTV